MEKTKRKKLAIIGASYLQLPLIEKARSLGYQTHVFAWAADDVGEKAADYFYPISIVEKEAIACKCEEIGICGICSIASDLAVVTVDFVAHRLGLTGNPPEITLPCTNKYEMRKAFRCHGDPAPAFCLVEEPVAALSQLGCPIHFPVIVKPTDRSGSRGVQLVFSDEELEHAVKTALQESFENRAIVEEYIEGEEFSLEGISWHGRHRILAMTKKLTTGYPYFIETGHIQPAPVSRDTYDRACRTVLHALDSLGIQNGASHSEIRIAPDGRITIVEIGARMGGDCIGSHLVPITTGVDYVKAVIDVACGAEPEVGQETYPWECYQAGNTGISAGVYYILNQEDERRMEAYRRDHPDRFYQLVFLNQEKCKDKDMETRDSSGRAGCFIVVNEPEILR